MGFEKRLGLDHRDTHICAKGYREMLAYMSQDGLETQNASVMERIHEEIGFRVSSTLALICLHSSCCSL